tara:strand:- start:306 stop:1013 length:708 start_codon:yes stop_codon:yes gene_type:complete
MKKLVLSIVSVLSVILFTTFSQAASIQVGVTGQIAQIEADGTETTGAGANGAANTNSASADHTVPIASFFAEYTSDYYGITFGAEFIPSSADVSDKVVTRSDTETSVTSDNTANSDERIFKAQASVENYMVGYAEIPVYNSMYLRLGIAQIDVNTEEVASSNGGNYGNETLDGINYGIGFKGEVADGVEMKIALEHNDFDTLSLTSTGNSVTTETNKISADLDTTAVKVSVGYKF